MLPFESVVASKANTVTCRDASSWRPSSDELSLLRSDGVYSITLMRELVSSVFRCILSDFSPRESIELRPVFLVVFFATVLPELTEMGILMGSFVFFGAVCFFGDGGSRSAGSVTRGGNGSSSLVSGDLCSGKGLSSLASWDSRIGKGLSSLTSDGTTNGKGSSFAVGASGFDLDLGFLRRWDGV